MTRNIANATGKRQSGGGGPTPWTPALWGPDVWCDAQDGAATGVVTTWNNSVGADPTQATSGFRPTKTAAIINGHEAIRFVADDFLLLTSLPHAQPMSVAVVGAIKDLSPSYGALFDFGTSPSTAGIQAGHNIPDFGGDLVYYAGISADTGWSPDTIPHAFVFIFDGAQSELWIDGVRQGGNINGGTLAAVDLRISGTFDGNDGTNDIGEFIRSPSDVGATGVADFTAYAAAKWGTANNGPSGSGAPVINTYDPPDGTQDNAMADYDFGASGDIPITWTTSGTLPPGKVLDSSTGVWSGTPTAAGTYNFTVIATNALGSDSKGVTVVIASPSAVAPTVTTTSLPNGTQGVPYSKTLLATGTTPITWTSIGTSLPSGLSRSGAVISGTPSGSGTTTGLQYRATNATGSDDSDVMSLLISAPGARQKTGDWLSVLQMDQLLDSTGGISPAMKLAANLNLGEISMGVPYTGIPGWLESECSSIKAQLGAVSVGWYLMNLIDPFPKDSTARARHAAAWTEVAAMANRIGALCLLCDGEPYGFPNGGDDGTDPPGTNNGWDTRSFYGLTRVQANTWGQELGAIVATVGNGHFLMYTSSKAGFPGSNGARVAELGGSPGAYDDNCFEDFVDGLITGGCHPDILDASFHLGAQNSDATDFEDAVQIVVDLQAARWDPADASASIMTWPDNVEGHGFFDPSTSAYFLEVATRIGTCPSAMYNWAQTDGSEVSFWVDTLNAMAAAW